MWAPGSGHDAEELISACLTASSPTDLLGRVGSRLADPEAAPWPPFAIAASRGPELVAVVHGPVELIEDQDGEERRLYGGEDVGSWLNRLLRGARSLRAGRSGDDEGLADLREGVIRASGFLLLPSGRPATARAAALQPDEAASLQPVQAAPRQSLASQGQSLAAQRQPTMTSEEVVLDPDSPTVIDQVFSDGDLTIADQDSSENALLTERDTIGPGPDRQDRVQTGANNVVGVCCPRDHLNDPRDDFCRTCGLPLVPEAPAVEGPRPPLGKLTWDNGEIHELQGAALVGRDVSLDGAVVSGQLAALVPSGQNDSMSRVHAELRPSGWDVIVVDRGSTNGTFIWDEPSKAWQRLLPDEPHVVRPGAVLAFGERTATFETVAVPAS